MIFLPEKKKEKLNKKPHSSFATSSSGWDLSREMSWPKKRIYATWTMCENVVPFRENRQLRPSKRLRRVLWKKKKNQTGRQNQWTVRKLDGSACRIPKTRPKCWAETQTRGGGGGLRRGTGGERARARNKAEKEAKCAINITNRRYIRAYGEVTLAVYKLVKTFSISSKL